ncbi:MAG: DUF3617 family protein [Steroidobacteraceae bacterium]
MTIKPSLLVISLPLWIGTAWADGIKPPPTKEGLWETRSTQVEQGKNSSTTTVKMCQSKQTTDSMQADAEKLRKDNQCTSNATQPTANSYVEETRCAKGPNAGSVTRIIYTHQGDTASHTEVHLNAGQSETVMIMDAKYVGSCPTGMKPGDLVINGKVVSGGN